MNHGISQIDESGKVVGCRRQPNPFHVTEPWRPHFAGLEEVDTIDDPYFSRRAGLKLLPYRLGGERRGMRGRSSVWYRIRINLHHVPEAERPAQEPLEVDYDPWAGGG